MTRRTRRRFLALAAGSIGLAGCTSSSDADATTSPGGGDGGGTSTRTDGEEGDGGGRPDSVGLETLAADLKSPLDIAFPGDGRRYIAERAGVVRVHGDGAPAEPLLDIRETVELGGEKGLLGVALHPDFPEDPRLFVRYSAALRDRFPDAYSHTFVLSSFAVDDGGARAPRDSERVLMEIPQPQSNHNAGTLAFGPEGYLYVATGDGGAGGDQGRGHAEDWYDAVGGGNGQDVTENLLGSILRIDVDGGEAGKPYTVPADNPLVGRAGLDEHYAWGFRNPWRMAFDRGDLLVGDVGQNAYEEVDRVVAGGNYGWNVREGTHCYAAEACPEATPDDVRGGEPLRDPVIEYPHSGGPVSGISVIGGQVYRGDRLPGLRGEYVFGDLAAGGRLFVATPREGEGLWPVGVLELEGRLDQLLAVGRDGAGEVYVLGVADGAGTVARLTEGNV